MAKPNIDSFILTARPPEFSAQTTATSFYTVAEKPKDQSTGRRVFTVLNSAYGNPEEARKKIGDIIKARLPYGDKSEINLEWTHAVKIPGLEDSKKQLQAVVMKATQESNHPLKTDELFTCEFIH